MTMFANLSTFADCGPRVASDAAPRFAVTLIDRRSGWPHCISGIPLTLMTRDPAAASADLLRNRDPSRWCVAIETRNRKGPLQ